MGKTNAYYDSDSGYLGGHEAHPEVWRIHGHSGVMVDMSEDGPLSPAVDDNLVNTCRKRAKPGASDMQSARNIICETGSLSGASDGAAASRRSAERLAWHAAHAGPDIEDPDGTGRRIT